MPINLSGLTGLATDIARASLVRARPNFELAFGQIEDTIARRVNKKIDGIIQERSREDRVLAELDSKGKEITSMLPFLERYRFDTEANALKLSTISGKLEDLLDNFTLDDDDTNFTANEIAQFNAAREDVLEDIERLYVVTYPGIADTKDIAFFKKAAATLEAFEPTEGAIDPEGATNPNVNRQLLDFISTIQYKATIAETSSSDAAFTALDLQLNMQSKLADIETKRIDITATEAQRKLQEIDDLKGSYANLLKAISLSYEVTFSQMETLNNNLNLERRPAPGSVLNIIT